MFNAARRQGSVGAGKDDSEILTYFETILGNLGNCRQSSALCCLKDSYQLVNRHYYI